MEQTGVRLYLCNMTCNFPLVVGLFDFVYGISDVYVIIFINYFLSNFQIRLWECRYNEPCCPGLRLL